MKMTYADGTPVREGDWVRIHGGENLGRLFEVIDTRERASARGLQGFGAVIDAEPNGFVFLSEDCLREQPMQFVRRGPSEEVRTFFAVALGAAALLVLPILYSLGSAIYSALTTGEVMVISLGRTETQRQMVPWQMGWARFAGPIVLCASLFAFDHSRGRTLRWWLAGAGVIVSLAILSYSRWFTTAAGALAFLGLAAFIASAALIDHRFGRRVALMFLAVGAAAFVWRLAYAV